MFFVISLINKISVVLDCLDNSIVIEAYSVQLNNVVHQQRPDGLASRKDFLALRLGKTSSLNLSPTLHAVSFGTVNEWGKKGQRQQKMVKQKFGGGDRIGHEGFSVFFSSWRQIFLCRFGKPLLIKSLTCYVMRPSKIDYI